ncbi:MAG: hypothetical protein IPM35_08400 [Myxococcales bacterium]|nr:hypothetical protein [Myxococcales bacterium]
MTHKPLVFAATLVTLGLGSPSASAKTPWPECVDNPACNQGGGCSVSNLPADASLGMGAVALAAAAALVARRRLTR